MKRVISLLLLVCMIPLTASADTDLHAMSFDELLTLRSELDMEIITRQEWKEVIVPSGEYVVGEDIPEGTYSISFADSVASISYKKPGDFIRSSFVLGRNESVNKITLPAGTTIRIENPVIFAPPKGLGF